MLSPDHSPCVQDQAVGERQFIGIEYHTVSVLNHRIASDALVFVAHHTTAMLARRLRVVFLAFIPFGCGIDEHIFLSRWALQAPHGRIGQLGGTSVATELIGMGPKPLFGFSLLSAIRITDSLSRILQPCLQFGQSWQAWFILESCSRLSDFAFQSDPYIEPSQKPRANNQQIGL
jgi:hypothetical protein